MEEKVKQINGNRSEISPSTIRLIIGLLLGILAIVFILFLAKKQRLKEEKERLENTLRLNLSFKGWNEKTYLRYCKIHERLPVYVRLTLIITVGIIDFLIYYISKNNYFEESGIEFLTHLLKDIAVWNFSILSIVGIKNFITTGSFGSTEKMVEIVVKTTENYVFKPLVKNIELKIETTEKQLRYDSEYIENTKAEIEKIDKELSKKFF